MVWCICVRTIEVNQKTTDTDTIDNITSGKHAKKSMEERKVALLYSDMRAVAAVAEAGVCLSPVSEPRG